jgi:hypothetical protein
MRVTKRIQFKGLVQPVFVPPPSSGGDPWSTDFSTDFGPLSGAPPGTGVDAARVTSIAPAAFLHPSRQRAFIWSTFTPAVAPPPVTLSDGTRIAGVWFAASLHASRQHGFIWSTFTPPVVVAPVALDWLRDLERPFIPAAWWH